MACDRSEWKEDQGDEELPQVWSPCFLSPPHLVEEVGGEGWERRIFDKENCERFRAERPLVEEPHQSEGGGQVNKRRYRGQKDCY